MGITECLALEVPHFTFKKNKKKEKNMTVQNQPHGITAEQAYLSNRLGRGGP